MLKEEIVFTNQSNLDELINNNNNNIDYENENYLNNNYICNNQSNFNIKDDSCDYYSKLEVDKQAYKDFKEELNNEFFVRRDINIPNSNYNYKNNKRRFLKSIENANLSKLNSSSIFNNKENLNLSNHYPSLNQNLVNNANNSLNVNANINCHNNNNYFQSMNTPKFINKEGKEIKFDSTLNSFKDLKNIHESVVKIKLIFFMN